MRSKVVVDQRDTTSPKFFTAGLVLGGLCALPVPLLYIVSLVVNIIGLIKTKQQHQELRWKPITGLCLTLGFGAVWFLIVIAFAVLS